MGFSRREYGSGLPFPSPGDLPNPGVESMSPALAGGFFTVCTTREGSPLLPCKQVRLYHLSRFYGGGGLVVKSFPTLAIPGTRVCQAPLSVGFSRQEYWSGLPFPSRFYIYV